MAVETAQNGTETAVTGSGLAERLERLSRFTPFAILAYFTLQTLIRIALSPNLEIDEAQFVGATHFALGYGNAHPPLYNWLVAASLWLTGGNWPLAVALLKNALLATAYLLAFDLGRRATGKALTGALCAASFLLLPQIVWMAQITHAHTVLLLTAVVAVCHALVMIVRGGGLGAFSWLGAAIAIGVLAKYNMLIFTAAAFIAVAMTPEIRQRVLRPQLWSSSALFLVMVGPHAVWALGNIEASTNRLSKLQVTHDLWSRFDVPVLGLDGLLSMAEMTLAWAASLIAVWFVIGWLERKNAPPVADAEPERALLARFFGRMTVIGMGLFAAGVLAGDVSLVRERYLTPVLMPLPFWLVLAWPMEGHGRFASRFLGTAAIAALIVTIAWPMTAITGNHRFALPYRDIASDFAHISPENTAILMDRHVHAANLALNLPETTIWSEGEEPRTVLVVWRNGGATQPPDHLLRRVEGYTPDGEPATSSRPYMYFSGEIALFHAQLFRR